MEMRRNDNPARDVEKVVPEILPARGAIMATRRKN